MQVTVATVFLVMFHVCFAASGSEGTLYKRCPRGRTFGGQQIGSAEAASEGHCAKLCLGLPNCTAATVCPARHPRANCIFSSGYNPNVCNGLQNASSPNCYFIQKLCRNGGTPMGSKCACTVQYSGRYCERYIRDCQEAVDNGHSAAANGVYYIQPINSPRSFNVSCVFRYGGWTTPLIRGTSGWPTNMNWTMAKEGFGNPTQSNFFVGLENLYYLTAQADYTFDFNLNLVGSSKIKFFYDVFRVASESLSYSLSYLKFYAASQSPNATNGLLTTSGPLKFATLDHDLNGCAAKSGSAGWYGGDCSQYSVFATPLKWPDNGVNQTRQEISTAVTRSGGFY